MRQYSREGVYVGNFDILPVNIKMQSWQKNIVVSKSILPWGRSLSFHGISPTTVRRSHLWTRLGERVLKVGSIVNIFVEVLAN
jgi:hypothetical protein